MPAEFDAHDPDYQLVWPADLFQTEATALLNRGDRLTASEAALLLEEAFAGETPRTDLTSARWPGMPVIVNPWGSDIGKDSHARAFLRHLASVAEIGARRLQDDWVRLVGDLLDRGYLDRVAPRACVDESRPSPMLALNAETRGRIGFDDLWPLRPGPWDEDLFCDLVEVVHDLVARPRHRRFHSYQQCGHHYADFAWRRPG